MEKINIDILMGTYNGALFLKEQLDSLLAQTNQDFRLIIRDDGSSDSTCLIIEDYISRYPKKIKWIKDDKKRLGVTRNFSCLLQHSSASYIMFCDQDDIWLPKKIEYTYQVMKKNEEFFGKKKPLLVHGDLALINKAGQSLNTTFSHLFNLNLQENNYRNLLSQNYITGCTMMLNRTLVDLVGVIPKEALMHDCWIALVAKYLGKIICLDGEPLIHYRFHDNNESLRISVPANGFMSGKRNSLISFVKRVKKLNYNLFTCSDVFRQMVKKWITQATVFYEKYHTNIPHEKATDLKIFINLNQYGWFKKRYIVLKNSYWNADIWTRIGSMFFL